MDMKRSDKSEATRLHILNSSFQLVLHKGFVGVGLQEILKNCDVPKGSFYYYFASKEAFGCALLQQYLADYKVKIDQLIQQEQRSAYASLWHFGKHGLITHHILKVMLNIIAMGDGRRIV
jgi:TetR/AcrR family transcriptional repressor of nem operon